jgi:hypothetical protein
MQRLGLGLFALVAACGGSTSPGGDNGASSPACSAACGGDVVGRWKILSYCGPSAYPVTIAGCAVPIAAERIAATTTGTFEFFGGGTYSASMTYSGTVRMTYPAACLTSGGFTVTCSQLGSTCAATTDGGCTCTATVNQPTTAATGTYSTNGNVLTTQPTTVSSPSHFDYCVHGNLLTMTSGVAADGGVTFSSGVGNVLERLP